MNCDLMSCSVTGLRKYNILSDVFDLVTKKNRITVNNAQEINISFQTRHRLSAAFIQEIVGIFDSAFGN